MKQKQIKMVLCLLGMGLIGLIQARGALAWDVLEKSVTPGWTDQMVVVNFFYSNSGSKAVRINNVSSCCSCTALELETNICYPNKTGTIAASFKLGNRKGTQKKRILVLTDDNEHRLTELTLQINIPEIVNFIPEQLLWYIGEKPVEKIIHIWTTNVPDVVVTGVDTTHEKLWPTLHTVVPGKEYELRVKPTDTKTPVQATFKIQTLISNDFQKSFMAYGELKKFP